jgi:peptidoglycan/LPS O-acetylase OafA/YrhL
MKYQPALDGLRGVAVCFVVAYHASERLLPGGWAGVDLFFALSGFLITSNIRAEIESNGRLNFGRFYLHRFLRLAPAFFCVLLFSVLSLKFTAVNEGELLRATFFSATYLMNICRAFDYCSGGLLGHTWSLSMEEQFYVCWPLLFFLIRKRSPKTIISVMIAAILFWRCYLVLNGSDPERTYNGPDTHMDAVLIGCLLSLVQVESNTALLFKRLSWLWTSILIYIFLLLPHKSAFTQSLGLTIAALLAVALIIACQKDGWLKWVLSLPPLVFIGRISYGLYLWHYPILFLGVTEIVVMEKRAFIVFLVMLSFAVATLSYFLVERPFLRLKARY